MIQLLTAAILMGLLGSFHCVGMCGPLALSLPLSQDTFSAKFTGALLYNAGRIVTYSVFGAVFGAIGKSVAFFGFQQWLSIILGVIIVFFIMLPKGITFINKNNFVIKFLTALRTSLSNLFSKKANSSLFTIGLLNGLLPCGLVYIAAAGAVATGDIVRSIFFMMFFGLGTLPLMWSITFFGNYISISMRQKIRSVYPYMMLLMASLLILRGLGLGIPYVSPQVEASTKTIHNCCSTETKHK